MNNLILARSFQNYVFLIIVLTTKAYLDNEIA